MIPISPRRARWIPGWLVALALPSSGATGQEVVAGWEGEPGRGYGFISPAVSLPLRGAHLLLLRGTVSYLYYDSHESSAASDVVSPGASLGAAYRLRAPRLSATLGGGIELRRTRRRSGPAPAATAVERGVVVQGDVFFQTAPLTYLNAIVSYGEANRYLWARAGVKRQVTNTEFGGRVAFVVGLEATVQGNPDVRAYQGGVLFALDEVRTHVSVQLRAGYARLRYASKAGEPAPYFGLGLYAPF